jgi:hypothetical protein
LGGDLQVLLLLVVGVDVDVDRGGVIVNVIAVLVAPALVEELLVGVLVLVVVEALEEEVALLEDEVVEPAATA